MGRATREKSNRNIIVLAIITTIIVVCFSFSKYTSTSSTKSITQIAKLDIGVQAKNVLEIPMEPVTENKNFQELELTITNSLDVTMEYTIGLESKNNLPLEFELYKLNEETTKYEKQTLETGITTEKYKIDIDSEGQEYKIKILWKTGEEYESYKYADLLDCLIITVDAEQVD